MPTAGVEDVRDAKRIVLFGVSGSGKSTLAYELGERLDLPVHCADEEVGWLPGWQHRPLDEMRARVSEIVEGERWVLDALYGRWRDLVLPRADVLIALDYPRWVSFSRLARRTLRRVRTGEPICNGNVETWSRVMSERSPLLWNLRTCAKKRRQIEKFTKRTAGAGVIRLASPRHAERLLKNLESASDGRTR